MTDGGRMGKGWCREARERQGHFLKRDTRGPLWRELEVLGKFKELEWQKPACRALRSEWGRDVKPHTHTLWGPPALGLVKVKVAVKVWLLMKGKANGNWKWGHREYQQAWYLHSGIFNHSARMDFRTQDIFITKRAKKKKRICFSVLETYQCEFKNLRIYKKQYQKQS